MFLFAVALGLLRLAVNNLANAHLEYHPFLRQGGTVVFGLLTGYLASGFLLCVLQTLPLQVNFLQFDYRVEKNAGGADTLRVLPPDHVWLALMRGAMPEFDPDGTFELRYARFRRSDDDKPRTPMPYQWGVGRGQRIKTNEPQSTEKNHASGLLCISVPLW